MAYEIWDLHFDHWKLCFNSLWPCDAMPHYVSVSRDLCLHWKRCLMVPGDWFNIKMPSYQYRKCHCGDKTVLWLSYLHNEISYTGKMASLYWIRTQAITTSIVDLSITTMDLKKKSWQSPFPGRNELNQNQLVIHLTHWGRDKMAAISQTAYSGALSWMKIHEFRLKFHWSLFLRCELTIFQHWFR